MKQCPGGRYANIGAFRFQPSCAVMASAAHTKRSTKEMIREALTAPSPICCCFCMVSGMGYCNFTTFGNRGQYPEWGIDIPSCRIS